MNFADNATLFLSTIQALYPKEDTVVLFGLVHTFTCAGMMPRQFVNLCTFAELGEVKQPYIVTCIPILSFADHLACSAEY